MVDNTPTLDYFSEIVNVNWASPIVSVDVGVGIDGDVILQIPNTQLTGFGMDDTRAISFTGGHTDTEAGNAGAFLDFALPGIEGFTVACAGGGYSAFDTVVPYSAGRLFWVPEVAFSEATAFGVQGHANTGFLKGGFVKTPNSNSGIIRVIPSTMQSVLKTNMRSVQIFVGTVGGGFTFVDWIPDDKSTEDVYNEIKAFVISEGFDIDPANQQVGDFYTFLINLVGTGEGGQPPPLAGFGMTEGEAFAVAIQYFGAGGLPGNASVHNYGKTIVPATITASRSWSAQFATYKNGTGPDFTLLNGDVLHSPPIVHTNFYGGDSTPNPAVVRINYSDLSIDLLS